MFRTIHRISGVFSSHSLIRNPMDFFSRASLYCEYRRIIPSISARWSSLVLPFTFCFRREREPNGSICPFLQIILTFSDITCIIRYRMSYIITWHCCNTKDCDRTCTLDINRLLITRCKATVKVSRITTV